MLSLMIKENCLTLDKLTNLMLDPKSHFQYLLHKEKDIKPAKYSNCIPHIVVQFGIKTQGLWK